MFLDLAERIFYTTIAECDEGYATLVITKAGYLVMGNTHQSLKDAEYEITELLKVELNRELHDNNYKIVRVEHDSEEIKKAIDIYDKYQKPFCKLLRSIQEFIYISWGKICYRLNA